MHIRFHILSLDIFFHADVGSQEIEHTVNKAEGDVMIVGYRKKPLKTTIFHLIGKNLHYHPN